MTHLSAIRRKVNKMSLLFWRLLKIWNRSHLWTSIGRPWRVRTQNVLWRSQFLHTELYSQLSGVTCMLYTQQFLLCLILMYGEFLSKHSKGLVNYELFLIFDLISNWVFTVLWEISMQVLSTIKTSSLLLLMQSTYFRVPPLRLISESLFGSEPGNTIHCILLSADV